MLSPTVSGSAKSRRKGAGWRHGVVAASIICLSSLTAPATDAAGTGPEIVRTAGGPVQATARNGMRSYFAIPYAAPPVGDLRWRPPQPAPAWTSPIHRSATGASCLQTSNSPFRSGGEGEDCLYLDVHAPTGKGPYPVMVWIHGGAFVTGSASVFSDPTPLVSKGVIVVAINYRLGAMGFLAHPALRDADGSAGDYGIMDQQAALRWVKANIAAFGGDPKNVTIFGESAGGFSVLTHLASPESAGLFHKAIIESGAYGVAGQSTQAQMEAQSTLALGKALSGQATGPACTAGALSAECLRGLPVSLIQNRLMGEYAQAVGNLVPSVDGKVLKTTIRATFEAGANNKVAVINGSNLNENRLFIAMGEMAARLTAKPPKLDPNDRSFLMPVKAYEQGAAALATQAQVPVSDMTGRYYPLSAYGTDTALQPSLASAAAGTDSTFSCNGANVSARIAAQGAPIWMYEFRDQTAPPIVGTINGKYALSLPQGAAHATELPYVFQMLDLQTPERKALQATMSGYWANFARTGNPNGPGVPAWAGFKARQVQGLDVAGAGGVRAMTVRAFLAEHQCGTVWSKQAF